MSKSPLTFFTNFSSITGRTKTLFIVTNTAILARRITKFYNEIKSHDRVKNTLEIRLTWFFNRNKYDHADVMPVKMRSGPAWRRYSFSKKFPTTSFSNRRFLIGEHELKWRCIVNRNQLNKGDKLATDSLAVINNMVAYKI